jgi:hypothetical protein
MNYRSPGDQRSYVCPGCNTPQSGPAQGGPVTCPQCRAPFNLPDRSGMLANPGFVPMPQDDPGRIQQLRIQDGRPRTASATLLTVLGGPSIQPGREQEAIMIWQSLRARSSQGDVAASEDLATLTLLLIQVPMVQQQVQMQQALSESTYDAAVLPRHKIEQLGRLARLAVHVGDRAGAQRYLSWMMPNAPELDADSEFRVSSAVLATMDRDANRVLTLLGPQKDALPIVDSMDPMASVFRANAYELLGNPAAAAQILGELPDPRMLDLVRGRFPQMNLCAQSGAAYSTATAQQGAKRAAASAGGVGCMIGAILMLVSLVEIGVGVAIGLASDDWTTGAINGGIGVVLLGVGLTVFLVARAKGKRAAWLRVNGVPLQARIVNASLTGTRINNVPVFQFALQVEGPHGPYAASFRKLVPEHQVAMLMGQTVRVRANPTKLDEVILEE